MFTDHERELLERYEKESGESVQRETFQRYSNEMRREITNTPRQCSNKRR
jgi:hypothetical protein